MATYSIRPIGPDGAVRINSEIGTFVLSEKTARAFVDGWLPVDETDDLFANGYYSELNLMSNGETAIRR